LAANAGDAPTASDKQIDVNIVFINKLSYLANHLAILPMHRSTECRVQCPARAEGADEHDLSDL
jgi:hypothetical protein